MNVRAIVMMALRHVGKKARLEEEKKIKVKRKKSAHPNNKKKNSLPDLLQPSLEKLAFQSRNNNNKKKRQIDFVVCCYS